MKTRTMLMVVMALSGGAFAEVYRVKPGAAANGSGLSWNEAMPFTNAMAAAAAATVPNEIWVAGTNQILQSAVTYTLKAALTIRGGFAGTETDASERPAGAVSVVDGIGTNQPLVVVNPVAAPLVVERMAFVRGVMNGLCKTGGGNLTVESCLFMTNGLRASTSAGGTGSGTDGKGIRVSSASGATITVRDSIFRANRQTASDAGGPGAALLLTGCAKAVVEDCGFFGNSLPLLVPGYGQTSGNPLGDKFTTGSAIYSSVPTTVVGCRFSGNICIVRSDSISGGAIWFAAGSTGSVVSNCFFHGNHDRASWNTGAHQGGAIVVSLNSILDTLKVDGCTFAYNFVDGTDCAAGITAVKGTLYLENCVFGGNMVSPFTTTYSRDLCIKDDAICHVNYTVFGQDELNSVYCTYRGTYDEGVGVVYQDPQFVTRPATIEALVAASGSYRYFAVAQSTYDTLEAIDAHLMSTGGYVTVANPTTWLTTNLYSHAIDAANPGYAWANEQTPNAGRRNAGFYGNTAEASKSSIGTPVVTADDIQISFDAQTHPTVVATNSGDSVYNATLTIEIFTVDPRTNPDAVATETASRYSAQSGDSVTLDGLKIYTPESNVYVRVTSSVPGAGQPVVVVKEATVTGEVPAYVGHGGGANVIHVRGGAAEAKDGSNWKDALDSFDAALAAAAADANKTEIWIAGTVSPTGATVTARSPAAPSLVIRGGFTGLEDNAAKRAAGTYSCVDGVNVHNECLLANTTGHTVTVERVAFTRMVMNGISKTGGGDLIVEDCQFLTNGIRASSAYTWTGQGLSGKGVRVTSATGAKITVRNSIFLANRQTSSVSGGPGAALYLTGCAGATVENCDFRGNCLPLLTGGTGATSGSPLGDKSNTGSALYTSVPTVVSRCRFSTNVGVIRSTWTAGGTLWFAAGSAGSVVSNCLFAGNHDRGTGDITSVNGGVIGVSFGNKTDVLTVTGSTFAYNLTDGKFSSGGINIRKGTVNLDNCVFGGNMVTPSALTPSADLRLTSDAVCNVSYTVFGYDKGYSVYSVGTLNEGAGIVYQDPRLVTDFAAISNLVVFSSSSYTYYKTTQAVYDALDAIDAHLLSSAGYVTNGDTSTWLQSVGIISPAIDAGHGDYASEPPPNGDCRNAGFYGNTPQASKTYQSQTPLGFTNVVVSYPDTYSRPQVSYTVAGDAGCIVAVTVSAVGDGINYTETFAGCIAGQTYTFQLPTYYPRGTEFTVSLSGTSNAGAVAPGAEDFAVDADLPVWWGRGGGAQVLHVWTGAPGDNDGSDWNNACHSWNDLVAAYAATSGVREIWFVDMASPVAAPSTLTVVTNLAFRGGFNNTENSPSERTPGARSTMDSYKLFALFKVNNAGHKVEVERLNFTRSTEQGYVKTGAGDIEFRDCDFCSNTRDINGNVQGRGLHVTGTAGTTFVALTNCVFRGNGMFASGGYRLGYGAGAYFANCARVILDDCLFVTNGVRLAGAGANYGGDNSYGSAVYATSAPLTARNCKFISNHGTCRESNMNGGAVRLEGNCNGSAFTNCLFAGNSDRCGWAGQYGYHGGALLVKLAQTAYAVDVVNCTFAYNLADGVTSPGGINVYKGTVNAKNSIVFGNFINKYSTTIGADVDVKNGGIFNASYCLFTTTDATNVTCQTGGAMTLNPTCVTGDPLFVTPFADVSGRVVWSGDYRYFSTAAGNLEWLTTIDCHIRGKMGYRDETTGEIVVFPKAMSPATDAGDPASDYTREPYPNGHRVNLGFYGNTPWATMSPVKGIILIFR